MSLKQNNDQLIYVPITLNGKPFSITGITSATYKLFNRNRTQELIAKQLNNGISVNDDVIEISISSADCEQLRGIYYHELAIVDPVKGKSTVISDNIKIEPTEI